MLPKVFFRNGVETGMQGGQEALNLRFDVVAPVNMTEFLADNPSACASWWPNRSGLGDCSGHC
jgi:hypothetical protein